MKTKISSLAIMSIFCVGAEVSPALALPHNPFFSKPSTVSLMSQYLKGNESFIKNNNNGTVTLKFNKSSNPTVDKTTFTIKNGSFMFLKDKGNQSNVKLLKGDNQNEVTLNNNTSLQISTKSKNNKTKTINFSIVNNRLRVESNKEIGHTSSTSKTHSIPLSPNGSTELKYERNNIQGPSTSTNTKVSLNTHSGKINYRIVEAKNPLYKMSTYEDQKSFNKNIINHNGSRTSTYIDKQSDKTKIIHTSADGSTVTTTKRANGSTDSNITYTDGTKRITKNTNGYRSEAVFNADGTLKSKNITVVNQDGSSTETYVTANGTVLISKDPSGRSKYAMRIEGNNPPTFLTPALYN